MALLTPEVHSYFDEATNAACYIVKDPSSTSCAIIDSIWNFDLASGQTNTEHADMLADDIIANGWQLDWIIETHVHADHLSAAPYLAQRFGAKIAIGSNINTVQKVFGKVFNAGTEFQMDGSQFDRLFEDGECFEIGNMSVRVMHTPGHTPACMVHVIGKSAFVGDTIFMPDSGTARADFPGGSAQVLYQSAQKILNLSPDTKLYLCHDYGAEGREVEYQTTVAEQQHNVHLGNNATEDQFVALREKRDSGLGVPRLMIPAIQVNMRAGHFPQAQDNGAVCLKLPINSL